MTGKLDEKILRVTRRQALQSYFPAFLRPQRKTDRPDIVVLLADDLGFSDIGCFGSEIATPNLDRLAARGARMTQFYNCARCCPTRASLLTGLYPHQAGIGYMEPGNRYNKAIQQKHSLPEYQGFLKPETVTVAELLSDAGYQTLMTGKWHVGSEAGQRPWERGFQRYFGILGGASNHFRPGNRLWTEKGQVSAPPDFYSTDAFSSEAAKFIFESDRDRPLFLYTAFTAPHWPIQAPAADIERYRGKYRIGWEELRKQRFARQKQLGLFDASTRLSDTHPDSYSWADADQDDMDLRMAVYAAMVDRLDKGVGKILEAIASTGRRDNTLIIFLSDNGACAEPYGKQTPRQVPPGPPESNSGYYLPWANASNTPFRLFKHWVHEGGIASPFIASWPGRIPQGVINAHKTGHVKDILATLIDAAAAERPERRQGRRVLQSSGVSLLPSLAGRAKQTNEVLYWEHEGNRAVRDGRWKLVSYFNLIHEEMNRVGTGKRTGEWELYDMQNDRTECSNLASAQPERVRAMALQFDRWAQQVGARDWNKLIADAGFSDN